MTSGIITVCSLVALGAALIAEHIFNLAPCPLCIWQRVPYVITAALGAGSLALALSGNVKSSALLLALCTLAFLSGAAIAFYHTGVEQHWWTSFVEGCKIDFSQSGNLLAQIEQTQAARCDEIPWADPVLGLSMAAWNVFASLALAFVTLAGIIMAVRKEADA